MKYWQLRRCRCVLKAHLTFKSKIIFYAVIGMDVANK